MGGSGTLVVGDPAGEFAPDHHHARPRALTPASPRRPEGPQADDDAQGRKGRGPAGPESEGEARSLDLEVGPPHHVDGFFRMERRTQVSLSPEAVLATMA